ncbi:MAG: MBL fold metallo-hydrolase [Gammaproteobacteria bacterium]|nr:MBL fold metallo-hydrolase [Gammaproteobacteria bacterium]
MATVEFFGAVGEVTGSCYLLRTDRATVLIECGMVQGGDDEGSRNARPFPFDIEKIDAVVLSHAHIDHSGRLPLLVKRGYTGPVYTHEATAELCDIMLRDAARIRGEGGRVGEQAQGEEEAERTTGRAVVLGSRCRGGIGVDSRRTLRKRRGGRGRRQCLPARCRTYPRVRDSRIRDQRRRRDQAARVQRRPRPPRRTDSKGPRAAGVGRPRDAGKYLRRPAASLLVGHREELGQILSDARAEKGNILIPAFAVGRTQELLYVFRQHFDEWGLRSWRVFLDSPMAIRATRVYQDHFQVYDRHARAVHREAGALFELDNLHMSETTEQSMAINQISSGAIVIAGSGMCTGGRIRHHLKNNISRRQSHVVIVGFQAAGTTGRALVDGARNIALMGRSYPVRAKVHTVGGLSAHADQDGLVDWYRGISGIPRVALVHGEPGAADALRARLASELKAPVMRPRIGSVIEI